MMLLWTLASFAQAPQKMSYQAVVRDATGKEVSNQELTVKINILQGAVDGSSVYSETHTAKATASGVINLEIGGGNTTDNFSAIDWGKGPFFIQSITEVDGKDVSVTSQLMSVPYALYAEKVNEQTLREMVLKVLADSGYVDCCCKKDTINASENIKIGALPGKFSVSDTNQVSFSKGNLQYQASTDTWRFAENQYDMVGDDNANISSTYDGWIDLFGYGNSGYNDRYPYMSSTDYSDYGNGRNHIAGSEFDWGVHNAISNGGNKAGMWRTLTMNEWNYILFKRQNADALRSPASVNGVKGYILLPDAWALPSGLTFTPLSKDYTTNVYSKDQWTKMETSGAIFLPNGGIRSGLNVSVGSGCYWTSTAYDSQYGNADYLSLSDTVVYLSLSGRSEGLSVRLVSE